MSIPDIVNLQMGCTDEQKCTKIQ